MNVNCPNPKRSLLLAGLVTLSTLLSAHCQSVPNPVAWWKADNNALDAVGANNGVVKSSFSYVPSVNGQGFSFAGGTVVVPDAASLKPATNLTVQVWVKGSAPSSIQYIVAKDGGAAGASYAFYTAFNGGIAFWVNVPSDTGNFGLIVSPSADPTLVWDGNWHQATGTYDGTAVRLYVDGVEIGTGTPYVGGGTGDASISYVNAGPMVFGNFTVGAGLSWPGSLDDVKVFNHTLDAAEVQEAYTNALSTVATNGLVAWWKAEGNALDSWAGNHGVVNAATVSYFAGKSGRGFLSAGGSVVISNAPALEPQTMTIQAWVKSTIPGAFKYILSKCRVPTWASYALYSPGNGGAAFFASIGASGSGTLTVSPVADPGLVWDGAWHQLTGTYDGSTLRLFVDGIEVGSGTPAPGGIDYTNSPALNNGALVIANDPTLGFAMSGGIDEIKLWDQALTPEQVLQTYASGALVSWYKADGDANDSLGNNSGSSNGAVTFGAGRLSGSAFKFNGGNIVVAQSATLESPNVTVEASVNAAPPGANKFLLSKSLSAGQASYALRTDAAGALCFSVGINGTEVLSPAADSALVWDGRYHFVSGSYDGSSVRLYVDGQEVGAGTAASGPVQYGTGLNGGALVLGDFYSSSSSSNFVGLVDNLKIFNVALPASSIQDDTFQPAFVTSQPQNVTVAPGGSASFTVSALPANVTYQWMFNGTNLAGATQSVLSLNNVTPAQAGVYRVAVSAGAESFVTNSVLGGRGFHLPGALVDIPQDVSLEPAAQVTLQAWVRKTGSPGGFKYIVTKSFSDGLGSYAFYAPGSGGLAFFVVLQGGAGALVVSPDAGGTVWDGNWHQVTGVYDGAFVRLYVDGQQVEFGTDTFGGGLIEYSAGRTTAGDLVLGDFVSTPGGLNYGGDLDEVKVFSRALSDSEVLTTFTDHNSTVGDTDLAGWWRAEGNTLDSKAANHGQIRPPSGTVYSEEAILTLQSTTTPAAFQNVAIASGTFQATLTGPSGQTFVIERADALVGGTWTPVVTNTVPFTYTDAVAGATKRFYRAVGQ